MLGTTYEKQNCSAARALEVVGERQSLFILRDALFRRMRRFSEFKRSLGLAPNVLAKRLEGFVASGHLEKSTNNGEHADQYRPTERGLAFKPLIVALTAWGDRWAAARYVAQCTRECDFRHVLVRPPVESVDPQIPDRR